MIGMMSLCLGRASADGTVTSSVLVQVRDSSRLFALQARYSISNPTPINSRGLYRVSIPAGANAGAIVQQLYADPNVIYAEQEGMVCAPVVEGEQLHFAFDASPDPGGYINQAAYQQVNLVNLNTPAIGTGTIVAVLDTGATFNHPDLIGHYLPGYNTIQPGTPPSDVPDGLTNIAVGHGTMIAGIIAKIDPGAQILPIRVLNADGIGTISNVVVGINYAISQGAKVINMSFGAQQQSTALNNAIAQAQMAGVILVASAGNDNNNSPHYPAAIPGVLGVASLDSDNTKSDFSDFGSYVDLDAPGDGIRSTYWTGGYASWSGTSFAAPFVSGEAALIQDLFPFFNSNTVSTMIVWSAFSINSLNPGYSGMLGAGIIDIGAALGYLPTMPPP